MPPREGSSVPWGQQKGGDAMDDPPVPVDPACGCPADARIARHFDAKAAAHSAEGWDASLIAVSQRLS